MIEEIDFKQEEEECKSQNNSFDDNYNSHSNDDLFLFSKENYINGNENFETVFKKVFNSKDIFDTFRKEEEKDYDTEKNKSKNINLYKKKIFKLIYHTNKNKFICKTKKLRAKKVFKTFGKNGKNNYKNYSFDELILYIKKLNNSSKTSSSILNKYKLLKLEHKLIIELKTRILSQIEGN